MSGELAGWAEEMRSLFRSGSVAQFILHGNIFDLFPAPGGAKRTLSLKQYLQEVMFGGYDTILTYDRGKGVRAVKGGEDWGEWLEQLTGEEDKLSVAQLRDSYRALELIDRYLLRTMNLQALTKGKAQKVPTKIAVLIEFAEFVAPRGDPLQLSGNFSTNIVKILGWANDPAILQCNIATVLLTEGLHDLNELLVENPHASKLHVPLPDEREMKEYLEVMTETQFPALPSKCEVPMDALAQRMTGLSRVGARTVLATALNNDKPITAKWLSNMKKEMIERECAGLLEFIESDWTLEHVAGLDAAKQWLREDGELLRKQKLHALPMGYLIAGRIGTGKTFLVRCWAGELGIPCVVFKNFRDRWVGATESNLEKIFGILRALGQVLVFVDEADQAAGKREGGSGDSGLSGRVYSMLAKEMSDTANRGKIVWIFATSRPDLLEVDLKRQGRLDVHIPLFAPQTADEMKVLLSAVAKKLKFPLKTEDLPDLPEGLQLGGNELEGILVRALRVYELSEPKKPLKEILGDVIKEVRPSAHSRKLEYMDLVAVKECTDSRFLPERFQKLSPEELEFRIDELRRFV
ncbi:MAG: ATPase AAA [Planctomycetota bacterium]